MNTRHAAELPLDEAVCSSSRDFLSLREVVTLADVPEKRVRKDIETGILPKPFVVRLADSRLCFEWRHVFVVAAVYGNSLLPSNLRKRAINRFDQMIDSDVVFWGNKRAVLHSECKHSDSEALHIDKYLSLDLVKVCLNVRPRVMVYLSGLSRIEEKDDILGGDAVFTGTRLPVSHIGKMVVDGENAQNIIEDFPVLDEHDIRFAQLYYLAHPAIGRPKLRRGEMDA